MQLYSLTIRAWRRFAEPQTLQINGKLIALVGPNEAGKSSILASLQSLDERRDIRTSDVSRGLNRPDILLRGNYHLDQEDMTAANLQGSYRAKLEVYGEEGKSSSWTLEPPPPPRDKKHRHHLSKKLESAIQNPRVAMLFNEAEVTDEVGELVDIFKSDEDTFPQDKLDSITAAIKTFRSIHDNLPARFRSIGTELESALKLEKAPSPEHFAYKILGSRFPPVLLFGFSDRDLKQAYSLDELSTQTPDSLNNLADVASLDLTKLISAMRERDIAEIETLKTRANRTLENRFKETWSQSGVAVSFSIQEDSINVVIKNDNDRFTSLAERSDGFRQFVALQSFILAKRASKPILLIDEAEQHLHYDAQADLMQMLARQKVAQKVIYTTHSAGCLPEDLGNGVRLIAPIPTDDDAEPKSLIVNRFWGNSEPGFTPLLMGMGATTLAFFPTRKALIVEGPCEMLLLPTLFREALEVDALHFQVVPGLSMADKAILPLAGTPAEGVCYLVDSDEGGRALEKEIKQNLPSAMIFRLALRGTNSCELEDLVDDQHLISAVNALISKFCPKSQLIPLGRLSLPKCDDLSAKFKLATGKSLSKVDLSYELLNMTSDDPELKLLSRNGRSSIIKLGRDVSEFFRRTAENEAKQ